MSGILQYVRITILLREWVRPYVYLNFLQSLDSLNWFISIELYKMCTPMDWSNAFMLGFLDSSKTSCPFLA